MNKSERMLEILKMLDGDGRLDIEEIARRLDVSSATARRDLDALASQNLLTRTRGGAVGASIAYDLPARYEHAAYASQKAAIAALVSSFVEPGMVVGLTGGTTCASIATAIAARPEFFAPHGKPSLTVVTNAIKIAEMLVVRPYIRTVVTGGVVHPYSYELVGPYAENVLDNVAIDIALIGVNGIDVEVGATVDDPGEADVNARMMRRAHRSIIVADSSKIGARRFARVGTEADVRTLATDAGITVEQRAAFADADIEVLVAEVP